MRSPRSLPVAVAVLAALSLRALACGSDDPAAPAAADASTPSPPEAGPGDACAADACAEPPATELLPGPYGIQPRDVAGPFTIQTTTGEWDLRKHWTGRDSYVFLIHSPGAVVMGGTDYSATLFKQSLVKELLAKSPPNVHYFFLPRATGQAGWAAARDAWTAELAGADAAWQPRVHFSDTGARDQPSWVGELARYRIDTALPYERYDALAFAIDPAQRIREVGMLGTLTSGGVAPKLSFLANEPTYYAMERAREAALAADKTTVVVPLAERKVVYDTLDVDVDLPAASAMAGFDTMEVDLALDCDHHRDGECGAWDYLSGLALCDAPGDGGDPDAGPACSTEIARWITPYWREGRWVTDVSGMLALLQGGGKTRMRWWASGQFDPRKTNYTVSLSLRLSNRGKGRRPTRAVPLWTGGNWDAAYDAAHPDRQVAVPASAKAVELYVLGTGHGAATGNCAEFCNHEHHFVVGGKESVLSFPGAATPMGCANDVGKGVVPNQHGTWYFGRGGWCPGRDVAPWVVDVTSSITKGGDTTLRYTTTYGGAPVTVDRGVIALSSYLVVWE